MRRRLEKLATWLVAAVLAVTLAAAPFAVGSSHAAAPSHHDHTAASGHVHAEAPSGSHKCPHGCADLAACFAKCQAAASALVAPGPELVVPTGSCDATPMPGLKVLGMTAPPRLRPPIA